MKKILLLTMLIATCFAPVQSNMFEELAEGMKSVATDAKDAAENIAYKIKKNTWNAPVLGYKHSGKLLTSATIAAFATDQLYSWYNNKKFRESDEYKRMRDKALKIEANKYKEDYDYCPKLRRTLPGKMKDLWHKKVPLSIQYAVEDYTKLALAITSSVIFYTIINKQILNGLTPANFKIVKHEEITDTLDSIIGLKTVKNEINEFLDPIKNLQKYINAGAEPARGCTLVSKPGMGKTSIARAVAKEAGVTSIYVNGSEFNGLLQGQGTIQVKKLHKAAKTNAPCFVFIDEFDSAVGTSKDFFTGTDTNSTTNAFKSMLDGFEKQDPKKPIFYMGATNNLEKIDKAIFRDGRMPSIQLPDLTATERAQVLHSKLYNGKIKTEPGIDTTVIANKLFKDGDTGATITALALKAASTAVRNNKTKVDEVSIYQAAQMIAARQG